MTLTGILCSCEPRRLCGEAIATELFRDTADFTNYAEAASLEASPRASSGSSLSQMTERCISWLKYLQSLTFIQTHML